MGLLVFRDVLFVPGLLQTLISEPQLEMKLVLVAKPVPVNSADLWDF